MKTRFLIITCLGLVFCQTPDVLGITPPAKPSLPNYDKRIEVPATPLAANVSTNAQQDQAAALLKSRVPGIQISKDKLLRTPSLISASSGFLTGPDGRGKAISDAYLGALPADDPHRVIKAFLNEHSALFGHDARVLTSARVQNDYVTKHNGLHTTVWEQTLDGIPVFEGRLIGHVTRNGELVSISSHFIPDAAKAGDAGTPNRKSLVTKPEISAAKAVSIAASNIGAEVEENSVTVVEALQGAEMQQTVNAKDLIGPAWAQLVWLPMNPDSMRLCWRVILSARPLPDRYLVLVDAETGEVLVRHSLTEHITPATYNVYTSDSPSPFSPGWPTPSSGQPPLTSRAMVTLSALDTNASPNGWVSEGSSPHTTGNNAIAFLDRNFDAAADVPLPQATARVFDFPLDLTKDPSTYESASTVQLFYRANWYHDRLYELGFTEAAGNYQVNNFGRGGLGGDPVICLVQAGADVGITDNSVFFSAPDGFSGYCAMFVFSGPTPNRDGSLDQEVVCHELTHGLSTRLVGGGVGISQLQTEGMGEGWSDFYSLCLLSEPTDDVNATYAEGGYASYLLERQFLGFDFLENYYYGIRRYPYTTDMSKNPLTFKDIDPTQADPHIGVPISPLFGGGDPSEVHNQGEVWCVTLREVWANLVTKSGWDVGNELVLQLVTDGMKLAPANPNFLEARDAIILADEIDTGGDNYVEIWTAFAKRGMGFSATSPASDTTTGVREAYDLPPDVIPDGILEIKITPPSSSALFTGSSVPIFVNVRDAIAVTNATITATITGSTNLIFQNNGVAPDKKANDSIYTTLYKVQATPGSVTITMVISAPGKDTSTNIVTYLIVQLPPNDYFTNATKVPAGGANYVANNTRATLETNEPVHAGVASVAASLWWDYTPTANTNILVDTAESDFRSVVAVYTNNTLPTLKPVVSSAGSSSRKTAFVFVPVKAGVTYHIAVAGYDTNNLGTLKLNIAPGGQPDTNAPVVTVTSPLSGTLVTTNRLFITGTAVDSGLNASGIKDVTISVSSVPGVTTTTIVTPNPSLIGPASTNWSAIVGLLSGLNNIQVSSTDFAGNKSTPVTVQVIYRVLDPPNDLFANAIVLTNTSGVSSVNTLNATKEIGEPNHAGNAGGKSAWWSYQPPADGVLTLITTNSTFDTLLGLYTGTNVAHLTTVADNDDAYPGAPGSYSLITQAVRSNQTYHVAVDGYNGAGGAVFLSYSFVVPATLYQLTVSNTAGGTVQVTTSNSLGGIDSMPGASGDFAAGTTAVLAATPNANYAFDIWSGDVLSVDNPLTVVINGNVSATANFLLLAYTDGFETGNLLQLNWTTGGNLPWIVRTNVVSAGLFAARSGAIANNQTSSLILSNNFHAGSGSFDYRVSSEPTFDYLKFSVDGVELQRWSGEAGWATYGFPLTAGIHSLRWDYIKDTSTSSGLDAAFIDNVNLPLAVGTNSSSPAHLQVHAQTGGGFYVDLTGQTNQQYILQMSTNLVNWQSISTNIALGGFIHIPDPGSKTNSVQFYRALVAP